eukprot:GEMP01010971.1.p1 GENE.GEMP01010971.1~~GEMP01010971.1.p1  ORF type:complete len:356 (+),score=78.38 GEMP01010971.1:68-1135(+)
MLSSPLFSELPGHLGGFAVAEKLMNQYCNKRQFSHTDDHAAWNPASHQTRLFHRISRPPTGDPFAPKIIPERQGLRSTVRPKSAPDGGKCCHDTTDRCNVSKPSVKGAFLRSDPIPAKSPDSNAVSSTTKRRPHSAAPASRHKSSEASPQGGCRGDDDGRGDVPSSLPNKKLPTKPMYTSKPKGLFWAVPYYTQGGMQHYWEEQGVKRSAKRSWSASVSDGPRRRFFMGARDPGGTIDGGAEVSLYQVREYPLSKNERRKLAYDKNLAEKCDKIPKWRSGIPHMISGGKMDPKARCKHKHQLNAVQWGNCSNPRGADPAWRGSRMGPPWCPPHNMRSYPVRPVMNGSTQRTVACN